MHIDFDPALRQLVYRLTGKPAGAPLPEDLAGRQIPVLARLRSPADQAHALRVVTRFGDIVTGRLPLGEVVAARCDACVVSLKAIDVYYPTLFSSVAAIRATPEILRQHYVAGVSGRGVIVAVIDWGCDFAHANFRDALGNTRLLALWDQQPRPSPASPAPYGYGRVIERDELNYALHTGDPYAAIGYDPRDVDIDGTGTHGSHVLDIAAGSGFAPGSTPGVAPEADLLFVHLRGDDTLPQETLGDSVRLLEAVSWIFDRAGDRPVVINTSLGRTGGPHDGTTLVERALDAAVAERPGRAIVMSTGNYFSARMHASGRVHTGQRKELRFRVPPYRRGEVEMEIWYSGRDELGAELVDPSGCVLARIRLGEQAIVRRSEHTLATLYHRRHDPNNGDHLINVFLWPEAEGGIWSVRLYGLRVEDGTYHAWIERVPPYEQARFVPRHATATSTTNTVCNGRKTIAVGAYNVHARRRPMAPYSSSGPTRDGRAKPDIVAPGSGIVAARSVSPRSGAGNLVIEKSGTSMAAPHVTGTVALMFEAALPDRLTIEETRRALFASAQPLEAVHPLDEVRTGAGRVDAAAAVDAVHAELGHPGLPEILAHDPGDADAVLSWLRDGQ